jgi:hypothetical protein
MVGRRTTCPCNSHPSSQPAAIPPRHILRFWRETGGENLSVADVEAIPPANPASARLGALFLHLFAMSVLSRYLYFERVFWRVKMVCLPHNTDVWSNTLFRGLI